METTHARGEVFQLGHAVEKDFNNWNCYRHVHVVLPILLSFLMNF